MKKYLIILASGIGSRFGADCPKQFVEVNGKMIIEYTLSAGDCGLFDELILVVSKPYLKMMEDLVEKNGYSLPVKVVEGGSSRIESCERGVAMIDDKDGYVIIHNGVQPFVKKNSFEKCLSALLQNDVVTSGIQSVYTPMMLSNERTIIDMPDRAVVYMDMGVEGFRLPILRHALMVGLRDKISTSIVGVVFRKNLAKVFVVEGDPENIKITYPSDLYRIGDRKYA